MANRDLTAAVVTEAEKTGGDIIYPVLAGKFEFGSGDVLLWDGVGNLTLDGETYLGASTLVGVSEVIETDRVEAAGFKVTLSGIPSSLLSIALTEDYQERPAKIWFAFLNASGAVVADEIVIFAGRMDVMSIQEGGATATIEVALESYLVDGGRARKRELTPEDQAIDYPADTGFRMVAPLQDAQILWGKG